MHEPVDVSLLPVFAMVAETGSFSGAAKRLGVAKSTVSRQVARLEEAVGTPLFHRTTRQVALSTAGESLLARLAPILASLEATLEALPEGQDAPSGRLRVTAPVDLGDDLGQVVATLVSRHPQLDVEVELTDRVVDLVAEGFDAALRASAGQLADSSLVARKLRTSVVGIYAAPGYLEAAGTPKRPKELAGHRWLTLRGFPTTLRLDGPGGRIVEVSFERRVAANDFLFLRAALIAGGGVGLMPRETAAAAVAAGTLVPVLPRYTLSGTHLYLVIPARRLLPRKVTAFRDLVIETFGD